MQNNVVIWKYFELDKINILFSSRFEDRSNLNNMI